MHAWVRRLLSPGSWFLSLLITARASAALPAQGEFSYSPASASRESRSADAPKVYNLTIEPHWYQDNHRFWYRRELPRDGSEFVVVDALAGQRFPAFDHAAVAGALSRLTGREFAFNHLPFSTLEFEPSGRSVLLKGLIEAWRLNLETSEILEESESVVDENTLPAGAEIRPSKAAGNETVIRFENLTANEVQLFWVDLDGAEQPYGTLGSGETRMQHTYAGHTWLIRRAGALLAVFEAGGRPARARIDGRTGEGAARGSPRRSESDAPTSVLSPDRCWRAVVRAHNLWIEPAQGNGEPFPLSYDGSPGDSYHQDVSRERLIEMHYERPDAPATLPEVFWSPDSTRLVAFQTQPVAERRVPLIESSPRDGVQPRLQSYPYLKPGDAIPVPQIKLFEIAARREIPIRHDLFDHPWSIDQVRWASNSSRFTFVYNQRGHQVLRVISVNASDGEASTVVDEVSATFIDYSSKFLCEWVNDDELLWMSERDGWNHLYLYDVRGCRLKRQVTSGPWVVRDLAHLDPARREVWFRMAGFAPEQDPYYFHLARVHLDEGPVTLLTEGDGTHSIEWSPDRQYFIDTWSRVDLPPIHVLRHAQDGRLVCPVEQADAAEVIGARHRFPERFCAPGRDGKTLIYGILHRPANYDPAQSYPVVECIYAGPHDFHVPKAFRARYRTQEELADRGLVVVQIDGMGTSWRSKAFHDVCWRNLKDAGFPDRIAWMKAAARIYPELDLSRVGIYGGSAGGQNAMAALLWHGDFYRVGVADCGCHDNRMDKIWWNEQWLGWPVGPQYAENSNVEHADLLQGKLLLIVGELDRNVDPASTLQVAGALQRANKDFTLQIIVGAGHGAAETSYGNRLRSDFLVQHLRP